MGGSHTHKRIDQRSATIQPAAMSQLLKLWQTLREEAARLNDEATELTRKGVAKGTLWERSDKPGCWYLLHSNKGGGKRRREYLGVNPDLYREAQARIKRHAKLLDVQAQARAANAAIDHIERELINVRIRARAIADMQRGIVW